MVLASWQAACRSSRILQSNGKRPQPTTEDGRKREMCDQTPHEVELHP
jgi:hypothetical protein